MATISIADNDARIQHSIGGGGNTANSTQFTIDFPFFSLDDINVTITNSSGVDTVLTRGSGSNTFAVSGTAVDDGFSGGNITLGSVYTSSTVTITRDIPIVRTSDFATSGPFNISSLNTELDKIYAVMQQIETDNDRSLTMPDSDALTAITLPGQTSRLGTVLGFNASTGQAEVGPTIANVNALSAITANINTVGGIASNVTTVAGIQANVTTVAGISSNVSSVAGNSSNINSAVSNASNINTVAGSISNVNTVGGAISNVNSVASNASNINTVAGKASLITSSFASDMALIDSSFVTKMGLVTSDFVTDMNLVTADFISDLNDIATTAIIADLDLLATSDFISDLNEVEGIKANVTTVAGISSNVTSVAGNASNINSAVSNASNINSAVSNASNINSAVSNASNINSVVSNASNINTVAGAISNVNTVGGAIANVNTVATNLSGVNSFADRYRVASSAPSSSLDVGDLYFDTTANELKVYKSSGWAAAGSTVNGTSARFHYDISGTPTSVTGNDAAGNTLAYDAGFCDVYVNGVRMSTADITITSGDTVTFASALADGDEVDIVAFGTFSVSNIVSTGALNSGSITSGFGNIDTGSSTITTTGLGTFGTLAVNGATTITTADNTTQLQLISTDADANTAPVLDLFRNSGSPADNDALGRLLFSADNDAGEVEEFGYIQGFANDVSNGSEDGTLFFFTKTAGVDVDRFNIAPTESVFNDGSVDVDFRVESNNDTHAFFLNGASGKIGLGTSSTDADLHIEPKTGNTNASLLLSNSGRTQYFRIENNESNDTLRFNANDTTQVMNIDSTGAVTKPLQPAFSAKPSSSQDNMAINSANTIVFGTEIYDQNSDFSSNTFTAPVTGKYFLGFTSYLRNVDIDAVYVQFSISTSNRTYYSLYDPNFSADLLYLDVNIGVVADMDVGDTAKVLYHQGGGNAQSDINTDSTFMGYLLG